MKKKLAQAAMFLLIAQSVQIFSSSDVCGVGAAFAKKAKKKQSQSVKNSKVDNANSGTITGATTSASTSNTATTAAVNPDKTTQKTDIATPGATTTSLKDQLDSLTATSKANMTPEVASAVNKSVDALTKSGITETVIKEGQPVPDFSLPGPNGKIVDSKSLLAQGPLVITFYRGMWCPYCNLALRSLEASLPDIKAQGASLVAISPQLPDDSLTTTEKDNLTYSVLSDVGNNTARKFGIVYKLAPDLSKVAKDHGVDLKKSNGDDSDELPLAATFIVKKDGTIGYVYAETDFRMRMEPSDIVARLKQFNAN